MADMGFLPVVRRLIDRTNATRQTLLFSATLEGPVDKLIRDYQHDPARHDVVPSDADGGEVSHHFWRVESHDRIAVTAEVVAASGPAVVFCRTKRGADRLSDRLAHSGLASAAIHGNRSQAQPSGPWRSSAPASSMCWSRPMSLRRGIHVDAVPLVVHFDPAADATDYVHRSGRTGRAGADGTVVSLIGKEHMATTHVIQRRLGLLNGLSSPEVSSLAVHGTGDRSRPVLHRGNRSAQAGKTTQRTRDSSGEAATRSRRASRQRRRPANRR